MKVVSKKDEDIKALAKELYELDDDPHDRVSMYVGAAKFWYLYGARPGFFTETKDK